MRMQTVLFIDGKVMYSKVIRASNVEDAISNFIRTLDIPEALEGYAHPIGQKAALPGNWRYYIRCSVTGIVTMLRKRPDKGPNKNYKQ